tara:strand:+ start:821 stop:1039 length:219 start_codon:yes stop_codon:yes gene_type:complete
VQIDKNVPMPESALQNSYGWADMEVGDSVFFEDEPRATQSKPSVAARVWGRGNGFKFSARTEGNGVRIWRVA